MKGNLPARNALPQGGSVMGTRLILVVIKMPLQILLMRLLRRARLACLCRY